MKTLSRIALLIALLIGVFSASWPQEKTYQGKILDLENNQYNLTGLTLSGGTAFRCRLKDTNFVLEFEKVRTLAFNTQAASPFKGFVLADIQLSGGNAARAYIDLDNYWLEGTEDNLKVRIKIKLVDVRRIEISGALSPEAAPTAPPAPPASL